MITLDHAGLAGPDIAALHAQYQALGFTLTPLARQTGRLRADGPVEPWGTANRCAMLRDGYIELLGIVDPALPANGLDRFIARYAGLHILALGIEDEEAALARLRAAGSTSPACCTWCGRWTAPIRTGRRPASPGCRCPTRPRAASS